MAGGGHVSALAAAIARMGTMAVALVCGVLTARLVITTAGTDAYALLSLLVTLPSLVSFTDLGTGAAIVNSIARSKDIHSDQQVRDEALSIVRVMWSFAAVVAVLNVVLLATGGWSAMLGVAATVPNAPLAAFACVAVFCVTICLGMWQRVLLGLRKNALIVLLQGIVSPCALLVVWLLLAFDEPVLHAFVAIGSFLASLLVALIGTVVAVRMTGDLIPSAFRRVFSRTEHGARVMHVGWPMLSQALSTPLSMASQRFILAQSATGLAVAQYGLAGQVFFSLQALVAAAGTTLWPMFAHARANGTLARGPFRIAALFGIAIALATLVVLWIGDWFFGIVSDGNVHVPAMVILSFGVMVTMQAILFPLGMFLMDEEGIRFQVVPSAGMALTTVVLAFALSPALGAAGPPLANAVSVLAWQVIPYALYIRVHRARLYGTAAEV